LASAFDSIWRTLGRHAEALARFAQRSRLVAVDPVAQLEHVALGLGELVDGPPDDFLGEGQVGLLLWAHLVGGEQVAQGGLAFLADRLVK
jgi:hypothetical protein